MSILNRQPSTSLFPSESPTDDETLRRKIQRESLIALYGATGGANWYDNEGWLSDSDVCTWEGVTCNDSGIVTGLELSFNNLIGTIPTNIGGLVGLG